MRRNRFASGSGPKEQLIRMISSALEGRRRHGHVPLCADLTVSIWETSPDQESLTRLASSAPLRAKWRAPTFGRRLGERPQSGFSRGFLLFASREVVSPRLWMRHVEYAADSRMHPIRNSSLRGAKRARRRQPMCVPFLRPSKSFSHTAITLTVSFSYAAKWGAR